MKLVIDPWHEVNRLKQKGLLVTKKNSDLLACFLKNFNINTFVNDYSEPFYLDKTTQTYLPNTKPEEIIAFYKFDKDLGNHLLRDILVIEKIINTTVATEIINAYNIKDKCLFGLPNSFIESQILPNLYRIEPKTTYVKFIYKLIKYLPTSPETRDYIDRNMKDDVLKWKKCPLDIMCLTWSFSVSFSLFIALDTIGQEAILKNLGIPYNLVGGFVSFLKNILLLRNAVSHNAPIFKLRFKAQTNGLNDLYYFIFKKHIKKELRLSHVIELIQYFSGTKMLLSRTKYYFDKLAINEVVKHKLNNIFIEDNE